MKDRELIDRCKEVIKSCETKKQLVTARRFSIIALESLGSTWYFNSKYWPGIKETFKQRIHELNVQKNACLRLSLLGNILDK